MIDYSRLDYLEGIILEGLDDDTTALHATIALELLDEVHAYKQAVDDLLTKAD